MKTKLTMIGLVMVLGGWMATGGHPYVRPQVRTLEQRVAELERLVVIQSQQIVSQQAEIERLAPLADAMEVITVSSGRKVLFTNVSLVVRGGLQVDDWLTVFGNMALFGEFIDNGP